MGSRVRLFGVAFLAGLLVAGAAYAAKPVKLSVVANDGYAEDTSTQANNNGSAVVVSGSKSDLVVCPPKGEPVSGGALWSFSAPDVPGTTPAAIRAISVFPDAFSEGISPVFASGSSDTRAATSELTTEVMCLHGPLRKSLKLRTVERTFASAQDDNNGAAISSGPVKAKCKGKERAIGWFNRFAVFDGGVDRVLQLDSVRVRSRSVTGILDSDHDATTATSLITAVCLRNPKRRNVAVRIRKASKFIAPSDQSNNAGGVLQVPPVKARCKKGERLASGGGYWSFTNPTVPGETLAQLQSIDLRKKSVIVEGGSDTDAARSTLTAQAICLKKL